MIKLLKNNDLANQREKNACQWFSSNLRATCKNSGTFEKKKKKKEKKRMKERKTNFPLSIAFDQALYLYLT